MKKGDKVQNFTLQNSEGKNISLSDLVSEGRALLLFFPLAFSSVCREELCTVKDNMKMYNSLHTTVAGISVDSFFTLNEFKKANNLNFTLISDFNREVSRQFNCLYEDYFGMKGVSKRSAFIVNKEMTLEYAEILENSDLLPDFKAIQKALLR